MTDSRALRVLHLNTLGYGGAAIAVQRLHEALVRLGQDSRVLIQEPGPSTTDWRISVLDLSQHPVQGDSHIDDLLEHAFRVRRYSPFDGLLSTDRPYRDLISHPLFKWADVIHLHWVARMLSAESVAAVQGLGKPVIWTLHDQAPFTGGCHYSGSCQRFEADCQPCPKLHGEAASLPALVLSEKQYHIDSRSLVVVCPSRWLAQLARGSAMLREADVRIIPNGVPIPTQRVGQVAARQALRLPVGPSVVLFGASEITEARKGYADFLAASRAVKSAFGVTPLDIPKELLFVTFGAGEPGDRTDILHLGPVDAGRVALAYQAADIFVLPTHEDNLPNTLLEAVAAGVAVVGYDTGGVSDVLAHGDCGVVVERGNLPALSAAIEELLRRDDLRLQLQTRSRDHAIRHLSVDMQAGAYLDLYTELVPTAPERTRRVRRLSRLRALESHRDILADQLRRSYDETTRLEASVDDLERHLNTARASNVAMRESLEALQQQFQRAAEKSARMAALNRVLRTSMQETVIYGTGDQARRVWEAVSRNSGATVVAFVDASSEPRTDWLGCPVYPVSWLTTHDFRILVAHQYPDEVCDVLRAAGIETSRILKVPEADDIAAINAYVQRTFPDPLLELFQQKPTHTLFRIGVFGTGSAAMKVWEAIADLDIADTAWFADNNPQQQGRKLLWVEVINPERIPSQPVDALVIGSMAREPIRAQLIALGVAPNRILTPDVQTSVDEIRMQLVSALETLPATEVAA